MKWNFLGFKTWPAANGTLDIMQGFDVFRASDSSKLPRDICEGCVCWREYGTCTQVQVDDHEADRQHRRNWRECDMPSVCLVMRNCCPILFFDFIGQPLPKLPEGKLDWASPA